MKSRPSLHDSKMLLKAERFFHIFQLLFEKQTRRFILNHGISIFIMSIVLSSAVVALQIVAPYL